jgi:hypothetical protein
MYESSATFVDFDRFCGMSVQTDRSAGALARRATACCQQKIVSRIGAGGRLCQLASIGNGKGVWNQSLASLTFVRLAISCHFLTF